MTRPNILFVMADQLTASMLPFHGQPRTRAPHLAALAAGGVVFDNAYCTFPLCAPSRFSLLTGRLPSRIGAFDNAAEFPAATPTVAHHLRRAGYRTCVAGKMHFVGPDQLHGFEERITTDIYPADFGWTPSWEAGDESLEWHHSMQNVVEAGPCARSLQIDFDDEVAFAAERWLYDRARQGDARPFFMMVSFSHPHDPYTITRDYWDLYDHDAVPMPAVGFVPPAERDPHGRRLFDNYDGGRHRVTEAHVRNARHAYLGMISYLDDKIGRLMKTLAASGAADETVVVFASDHGDMLGERGMWYKMSFREPSARVPLIVNAPGRFAPRRVAAPVSLVDLFATLLDLGAAPAAASDGHGLGPLLAGGDDWPHPVYGEYLAEATAAPRFMIRRGRHKYIHGEGDPPRLYDLDADPLERVDLAADAALVAPFAAEVARVWDADALRGEVINSQRRRRLVFEALMTGARTLWDHAPRRDPARAYIRNLDTLYGTEARARLPDRRPPD